MSAVTGGTKYNLNRREFLAAASTLATGLFALPNAASAEPQPEIKKLRFLHAPAICLAPQLHGGGIAAP